MSVCQLTSSKLSAGLSADKASVAHAAALTPGVLSLFQLMGCNTHLPGLPSLQAIGLWDSCSS